MESEQIMRKWAQRRGWSALTKEMLVYAFLDELGMEEGWMQEYDTASHYYRPDFDDRETPFKDIRDFQQS